jgi:hypothetical protein
MLLIQPLARAAMRRPRRTTFRRTTIVLPLLAMTRAMTMALADPDLEPSAMYRIQYAAGRRGRGGQTSLLLADLALEERLGRCERSSRPRGWHRETRDQPRKPHRRTHKLSLEDLGSEALGMSGVEILRCDGNTPISEMSTGSLSGNDSGHPQPPPGASV